MLLSMDFPFGKSAPRHHPGKRFVNYLIVSRSKVHQEAAKMSETRHPDRIVPSRYDIISEVLSTLDREGGKFKKLSRDGEWRVVSEKAAREKVSQLFTDYKSQQKKKKKRGQQPALAGDPPIANNDSFALSHQHQPIMIAQQRQQVGDDPTIAYSDDCTSSRRPIKTSQQLGGNRQEEEKMAPHFPPTRKASDGPLEIVDEACRMVGDDDFDSSISVELEAIYLQHIDYHQEEEEKRQPSDDSLSRVSIFGDHEEQEEMKQDHVEPQDAGRELSQVNAEPTILDFEELDNELQHIVPDAIPASQEATCLALGGVGSPKEVVNTLKSPASSDLESIAKTRTGSEQPLDEQPHQDDRRKRERSVASRISTEPDTKLLRPGSSHTLANCSDTIHSDETAELVGNFNCSESVGEATTTDHNSFMEWISHKVSSISFREKTTMSSLTSDGKKTQVWKARFKKMAPATKSPQDIDLTIPARDDTSLCEWDGRSVCQRALKSRQNQVKKLLSKPADGPSALQQLEELLELGINEDGALFQCAIEILDFVLAILKNDWGVSVQHRASEVIRMVCLQPEIIIDQRVLRKCTRAVIKVMDAHPENAGIQSTSYGTLGTLVLFCTKMFRPKNRFFISFGRTIQKGIATMTRFHEDADVQCHGCLLLGSIALVLPWYRQHISNHGGAKVVLQAMRQHPDVARVQGSACWALGIIRYPQNYAKTGLTEINLVLAAMVLHKHDKNVQPRHVTV